MFGSSSDAGQSCPFLLRRDCLESFVFRFRARAPGLGSAGVQDSFRPRA